MSTGTGPVSVRVGFVSVAADILAKDGDAGCVAAIAGVVALCDGSVGECYVCALFCFKLEFGFRDNLCVLGMWPTCFQIAWSLSLDKKTRQTKNHNTAKKNPPHIIHIM